MTDAESSSSFYQGHYVDGEFQYQPPIDESAAFITDIDPDGPLPPDLEALQALKFEETDPNEKARVAKEEGNYYFKKKDYQKAREEYTEGLKSGCKQAETLAILYGNRAAVEFRMENFGRCIRDCRSALEWNSRHVKAAVRGADALLKLEKPREALKWCDEVLITGESGDSWSNEDQQQLTSLRTRAAKSVAELERKIRQSRAASRKKLQQREKIRAAVVSRGLLLSDEVSLVDDKDDQEDEVYLDSEGRLHWPVMILYPEFGTSDYLRDVSEDVTLYAMLETVFDLSDPPSWDADRRHTANTCDVLLELNSDNDTSSGSLCKRLLLLRTDITVTEAYRVAQAKDSNFRLAAHGQLILSFLVVCRETKFYSEWTKQYSSVIEIS